MRLLLFIILAISNFSLAQDEKDSLWSIWKNESLADTVRLNAIENISSRQYLRTNPDSAFAIAQKQLEFALSISNIKYQASALSIQGSAMRLQGKPNDAVQKLNQSNLLYNQIGDEEGVAANLHFLGTINFDQGNKSRALDYLKEANRIREKHGDPFTLARSYNALGYMYDDMGIYDTALDYHTKCLSIRIEIEDKQGESWCYNNIARVYFHMKQYEEADSFFQQSIQLKEELNEYTLGETQGNLGLMYLEIGRTDEAVTLCEAGLLKSEQVGFERAIRVNCDCLYQGYKKKGNSKKALFFYETYIQSRDSSYNIENSRSLLQSQIQFEFEMKEALAEMETVKRIAVAEEKEHRQRLISYGISVGAIALFFLLAIIFKSLRKAKEQQRIIQTQIEIVDQKNKEITDSINYAKRIQSAILPPDKLIKEYLPDSFVFYKPKDIVAGDFYWIEKVGDNILFAAADCTGHGVPGALVSVVCNGALNRSVREFGLTEPGEILDKAREIVIQEFEKSEEAVNDGMDVALCSLGPSSAAGASLRYAGAHNPLWIRRDGEIIEVKADKQPIGKFDNPQPYVTHSVQLQPNDIIYVFTDGYIDQFGGDKGKKLKAKNFKELLLELNVDNMPEQLVKIDSAFGDWKGELEQLDDVCVFGIKI